MFDWLFKSRRDRRAELRAQPFPAAWLEIVQGLPFYGRLDDQGQETLRQDLRVLVVEKEWEGCGGLEMTDAIKVVIAAQASLLLLHIEHDFYPSVQSILVYPHAYVTMPGRGQAGESIGD